MKTEQEIKEEIKKILETYSPVLDGESVMTNITPEMIQLALITSLEYLYWVIGQDRPRFNCEKLK
jgi:hypothetical protein